MELLVGLVARPHGILQRAGNLMVQAKVFQKNHQLVESSSMVPLLIEVKDPQAAALVPEKNCLLEALFGSVSAAEGLRHGCGSWCGGEMGLDLVNGCGSFGDPENLREIWVTQVTQEVPDLRFDWLKADTMEPLNLH